MITDGIQSLNAEITTCRACSLGHTRTNAVAGEGSTTSGVMFVGEAPGATEDSQGRPFCGKAGKVLDDLLGIAGLNRQDVFICNILKCRPPNNRNPRPDEIQSCTLYLNRQIELIKPKIVCCLGNFATSYIMKKFGLETKVQGITKIHGNVFIAAVPYGKVKIMPLFHPAVITYDMNKKEVLVKDFRHLKNVPK